MSDSTNTTITSSDELILQAVGRIALSNLGVLVVLTLFYGVFIALFSASIYTTIRRGLHERATWIVLVGTSVNFGIQTVQWILTLTWLVFLLQIILIDNPNLSLEDRVELAKKAPTPFVSSIGNLQGTTLIISDAFVIWRASVMFTRKRAMLIPPVICLCGTVGAYIVVLAISPNNVFASNIATRTVLALSIMTNSTSTGLIGWRLWIYRKHVLPELAEKQSPVQQVITSLVESDAAFCFLQIIVFIIQIKAGLTSPSDVPIFETVMQEILFSLAVCLMSFCQYLPHVSIRAMYPTFITLICCKRSSRIDKLASIPMSVGNNLQFSATQASYYQSIAVSVLDSSLWTSQKPDAGCADILELDGK